jgi:hypothetical protein
VAHMIRCLAVTLALICAGSAAQAGPVFVALLSAGASIGAAFGATAVGTFLTSFVGRVVVVGLLSGAQARLRRAKDTGLPRADEITLNRIAPVANGLILYGERILGGNIVARSTTEAGGKQHARLHLVMTLACHEVEGAQEAWIGETSVWTKVQYDADALAAVLPAEHWGQVAGPFQHKFVMLFQNGARNQLALQRYVTATAEWTGASRGRGIAYVYFEADYDRDLFPNGAEQVRVRLRGKRVYDPRTATTVYSANPFLIARDYALTPELYGGIGWRTTDLDDAELIALANIADEAIPLVGGGTEARYAFNGVLDTGAAPSDNLDALSTSWGGWWTADQGKLRFGGAAYALPVLTITEDMMVGPIKAKARRPFEEQFNVVKATFADARAEFVPTDAPVLASDTYRAQDNGEDLVRDLGELPGETSWTRAQRLIKMALLKGRRQKSVEVPCSLAAWPVRLGDTVALTVPRRGWLAKEFEVTARRSAIGPDSVSVTLSMIETAPDLFDWLTSEEDPYPAGMEPTLALPWEKPVVAVPSVAESLYQTRGGGGVKVQVVLTSATTNPFVELWQFSFRELSEAVATVLSLSDTPDQTIRDMAPGIYIFGARARNRRGVWSDWAYSAPREVYGQNLAPQALTRLSAAVVSGLITLRWRQSVDLDVRQGGVIQIRHSADFAATWQTSTTIGQAVPGSATVVTLPAIPGRYLLRAVDATGNPGPAVTYNTTAPNFQPMVTEALLTESPGFAGTKTNCSVTALRLGLDTGQVLGVYDFAAEMNFGALKTVRLTANVAVLITERSDLMDSTEMFDSFALFDGSENAEGDVQVYCRTSQDATATWSGWIEFDRTDLTAWRIQFKAELTVPDSLYQVEIDALSVIAERV